MNCYQAKTGELSRQWYVIDASEQVVGRLAAQIAPILMGKHRPTYTPHIDTGDYVIVTNVDKVVFTGNKWQQKSYQRYSGYPAGQRDEAAWKLFQRRPERILELAIQRMLPKSKLGRQMIDKLKLHVGANHPHQAQQPIPLEPLSGRPAPAGALFAPPPVPRGARKKAGKPADEVQKPAGQRRCRRAAVAPMQASPTIEHAQLMSPPRIMNTPKLMNPRQSIEHAQAHDPPRIMTTPVVEPAQDHEHAQLMNPPRIMNTPKLMNPPRIMTTPKLMNPPRIMTTPKLMNPPRIMTTPKVMTTPTSRKFRHRPSPRAIRTAHRRPLNETIRLTQADRVPLKLEKD